MHKVGIASTETKVNLKKTLVEMQTLSSSLLTSAKETTLRNAAVHQLLTTEEEVLPTFASCEEVSKAAMPAKSAPTSLGAAALEPGKHEELNEKELQEFLQKHELTHLSKRQGIAWRAKKLQFALESNDKLINPELSNARKVQIKELLIEAAECLATKIEDLKRPCNVTPVDIPTSSPPIRQKAFKLSPTDLAFLEPTIQSMMSAGVL